MPGPDRNPEIFKELGRNSEAIEHLKEDNKEFEVRQKSIIQKLDCIDREVSSWRRGFRRFVSIATVVAAFLASAVSTFMSNTMTRLLTRLFGD